MQMKKPPKYPKDKQGRVVSPVVVKDLQDVSGYTAAKTLGARVGKRPAMGAKGLAAKKRGK